MSLEHFRLALQPEADPAAIVRAPHVRFTVLTSRLIRLEHSPTETFEDRASPAFWYRRQPVPVFETHRDGDVLEIETAHLKMRYILSPRGFTPRSLSCEVKTTGATWNFGDHPIKAGNLWGTARTLDEVDGQTRLDPGLMARQGWAVFDDSRSLVFGADGWLNTRAAAANADLYFFGYGHDYQGCLGDLAKLSGPTPLIPRWALGNWWSRYWAYSQDELKGLMRDFEAQAVPLSVCIIDMDWHITATGNAASGWTGYTWNTGLFPDPAGFIQWLHDKGLKTALNLHPADGVFPHEAKYPEMARAVGLDPATQEPVPFDIADRAFTDAYFTHLHHPLEAMGVDFWWMDWQQGTQSRLQGLDPLGWLNHLHFLDLARAGHKRPFIFSRWGGLGHHRYPIGFSGDSVVTWESLAFQPYFTATAANVGYSWWSHDIGGHMWGIEDGELYLRWVQYGVFSPILRLHSTKDVYSERRPWGWNPTVTEHARAAMQLRHALIPYIYTMAWRNTEAAVPLITPLYYSHPEEPEAYEAGSAYWFGSELIAAPFTSPTIADLGLSRQRLWLPEGEWTDFFTGARYVGGWHIVYGGLSATPLFARAGAIVPLGPRVGWGGVANPEALTVHVFAGADNRFTLYEDDGETLAYRLGKSAQTVFALTWTERAAIITIAPVVGDASVVPAERDYTIVLHGVVAPEAITLNGRAVTAGYDAQAETLTVPVGALKPGAGVRLEVSVSAGSLRETRDRRAEAVRALLRSMRLDSRVKGQIDGDLPLLLRGERGVERYALTDAQAAALAQALHT